MGSLREESAESEASMKTERAHGPESAPSRAAPEASHGASRTEFVGETVEPVAGTFDPVRMARGEPGLPGRFRWRGEEHEVAQVLETRRETGDCRNGSGEKYARKHWYRLRTTAGLEMKLSYDRRAFTARDMRAAWCLHSVARPV